MGNGQFGALSISYMELGVCHSSRFGYPDTETTSSIFEGQLTERKVARASFRHDLIKLGRFYTFGPQYPALDCNSLLTLPVTA